MDFGFKLGLRLNAFAYTQFTTEVKTKLQSQTKVNPDNPVLDRT